MQTQTTTCGQTAALAKAEDPEKPAHFSTCLCHFHKKLKFGTLMETIGQEYTIHPTDTPGQFIHEYPGGRRVLVEIDPATGAVHFIREL